LVPLGHSEDSNIFENFFLFFDYLPLGNFWSLLGITVPTFVFFNPA